MQYNQPPQMSHFQQPMNNYHNPVPRGNFYNLNSNQGGNLLQNTSEKIVGQKLSNIFVREIWLGGIP
jgi:hypothetical protein